MLCVGMAYSLRDSYKTFRITLYIVFSELICNNKGEVLIVTSENY